MATSMFASLARRLSLAAPIVVALAAPACGGGQPEGSDGTAPASGGAMSKRELVDAPGMSETRD